MKRNTWRFKSRTLHKSMRIFWRKLGNYKTKMILLQLKIIDLKPYQNLNKPNKTKNQDLQAIRELIMKTS